MKMMSQTTNARLDRIDLVVGALLQAALMIALPIRRTLGISGGAPLLRADRCIPLFGGSLCSPRPSWVTHCRAANLPLEWFHSEELPVLGHASEDVGTAFSEAESRTRH